MLFGAGTRARPDPVGPIRSLRRIPGHVPGGRSSGNHSPGTWTPSSEVSLLGAEARCSWIAMCIGGFMFSLHRPPSQGVGPQGGEGNGPWHPN